LAIVFGFYFDLLYYANKESAFLSGFASSGFSVGTTGYGGFVGRTTIVSLIGGTASAIAGGDFKNGAMTGAFTHMFNDELGATIKNKQRMEKEGRKDLSIGHGKGEKGYYVTDRKGFKYAPNTPERQQHLESLQVGLGIPLTIVEYSAGGFIPQLIMAPYSFYSGANFVSVPTDIYGVGGKIFDTYIRK